MRYLSDNAAVFIVAAVVSTLAWLFGGTRGDLVRAVVPWLMLFLVQALVFFPQKKSDETTYDARERIWRTLKRDPLMWTVIGVLFTLAIPFLNRGLCVYCDRVLIAQGHPVEPPVPVIPFCVNIAEHFSVFLWFAVALTVTLVAHHALNRRGKRLLLRLLVINGSILAALGFIQTATGAEGPLWQEMKNTSSATTFFATFGYPNMAGDYFVVLMGVAIALWRDARMRAEESHESKSEESRLSSTRRFWRRNVYLLPTAIFFFAAVNTLSRAAMILGTCMLALAFVHSFLSFAHGLPRAVRVKRGTVALVALALVTFFALVSLPEDVQKEVDTLDTTEVLTRVTGKGQYHNRVATVIWKDHTLFGCGGWGYKHFCVPKMTKDELRQLQMVGGINVHNDYLQFLAEHGLVVFGALAAIVIMLVWPVARIWKSLASAARFMKGRQAPAHPRAIFALPAPAFFLLASALVTLIHAFADCPFRSPAVMALFFTVLSTIPGFLPQEEKHHHGSRK